MSRYADKHITTSQLRAIIDGIEDPRGLLETPSLFQKDLAKIAADEENFDLDIENSISVTPKGIHYTLGYTGGDWENPVHFAVYVDNKQNLRAYIPKAGNTYDIATKSAYGNEDFHDDQEARWISLGFDPDAFDPDELATHDKRAEISLYEFEQDIDARIALI